MIAVIFEVWPAADGGRDSYLHLAAKLAPILATIDGFISVERFESIVTPGRLLSLSFWCDEAAVAAWRNTGEHRATQRHGRDDVFTDDRLRIAGVVPDYGMVEREQAPADSRAIRDPCRQDPNGRHATACRSVGGIGERSPD